MWLVYPTQAEAEAGQAIIWDSVRPPFEVRAGQPVPERITVRWAVPLACGEGWAIPRPQPDVPGAGGLPLAAPTFPPVPELAP